MTIAWVAALASTAACGGGASQVSGEAVDPFTASLRGTWWTCQSAPPRSQYLALTITGPAPGGDLAMTLAVNDYANPSCAGAPEATRIAGTGSIHVGPGAMVDLDGVRVTARRVDAVGSIPEIPFATFAPHDLGYVRTDVTPGRLYLGLKDAVLDGATVERRPVEVWPASWLIRG